MLPAGYSASAAWGFHDEQGFAYEFFRVYGPPHGTGIRGEFSRIVEALSFWSVSFPTFDAAGNERIAGRWASFANAQKVSRTRLTFQGFSSPLAMCHEVPRLLGVSDIPMHATTPWLVAAPVVVS